MKKEEKLDTVFNALANHKRRIILHELTYRPATITYLAKLTELSLPAIYKHMTVLEEAELIIRKKSGRSNFIALSPSSLAVAQEWISKYHTYWGNPEATLENYIENLPE